MENLAVEILILISLLIIIVLLVGERIRYVKRFFKNRVMVVDRDSEFLNVLGEVKPSRRIVVSGGANIGNDEDSKEGSYTFEAATQEIGDIYTEEEPDEVLETTDWDDIEGEWDEDDDFEGKPDTAFALGVTFEELSIVEMATGQQAEGASLKETAVAAVHKLEGAELFSLLERSVVDASHKITRLLDRDLDIPADSGSSILKDDDYRRFNINDYM